MIAEWFSTVFSQPTEQARLFAIVISTFLAITLLLMNQWFIHKRARKERLIEKLEELTSAIHEFHFLGVEVNRYLHLKKKYDEKMIDKFIGLGVKIDTLCILYFKSTSICTRISADIISIGVDELNEPELENGMTIPSDHPYMEVNKELGLWLEGSECKVKALIKKYIK